MSSRNKLFIVCLFCWHAGFTLPLPSDTTWRLPPSPTPGHIASTPEQALLLLKNTRLPDSSAWWPHVKLSLFIENLKANISFPLKIYQGSNTNFCGYAAMSYLPLQDDPLTYTRFMLSLYLDGKATWNNIVFQPSPAIHLAVGT